MTNIFDNDESITDIPEILNQTMSEQFENWLNLKQLETKDSSIQKSKVINHILNDLKDNKSTDSLDKINLPKGYSKTLFHKFMKVNY